jgi:hypothetical protein
MSSSPAVGRRREEKTAATDASARKNAHLGGKAEAVEAEGREQTVRASATPAAEAEPEPPVEADAG